MLTTLRFRRRACAGLLMLAVLGCGGPPGAEYEDQRRSSYAVYNEGVTAFDAKNYAAADEKLTAALDAGGLNPDVWADAVIKRAVCRSAAGQHDQALADLDQLLKGGGPQDVIYAARSFILMKQGKAAEARAELAKARRINRSVKEFK